MKQATLIRRAFIGTPHHHHHLLTSTPSTATPLFLHHNQQHQQKHQQHFQQKDQKFQFQSYSHHHHSHAPPSTQYKQLIAQRKINPDEHQLKILKKLDELHSKIKNYQPPVINSASSSSNDSYNNDNYSTSSIFHSHNTFLKKRSSSSSGGGGGWFSSLLSSNNNNNNNDSSNTTNNVNNNNNNNVNSNSSSSGDTPRSIYMYGGVGCGKTMLMDLFYHSAPTQKKLRIHFNSFMVHFHNRMHELRSKEPGVDHIPTVVRETIQKNWLLCFGTFLFTAGFLIFPIF